MAQQGATESRPAEAAQEERGSGTPIEIGVPGDRTAHESMEASGASVQSSEAAAAGGAGVLEIAIEKVAVSPHQPRRVFSEEAMHELTESVRQHGVMQPVLVRRSPDAAHGGPEFELIAGERRWRAAQAAGLSTIPALVREVEDRRAAEWALIENVQRSDLNAIERAEGMQRLIERFGLTQQEVSDRLGLSRSGVANLVRLLELDEKAREYIASGLLTAGHGRALLSLSDGAMRASYATRCVKEQWSVRRLESEVQSENSRAAGSIRHPGSGGAAGEDEASRPPAGMRRSSPEVEDMERRLGEHLGTRVRISVGSSGRGRVSIEFFDLDHFDSVLAALGYQSDAM